MRGISGAEGRSVSVFPEGAGTAPQGGTEMADEEQKLAPYLGPTGAWAMALGSSTCWGALVISGCA